MGRVCEKAGGESGGARHPEAHGAGWPGSRGGRCRRAGAGWRRPAARWRGRWPAEPPAPAPPSASSLPPPCPPTTPQGSLTIPTQYRRMPLSGSRNHHRQHHVRLQRGSILACWPALRLGDHDTCMATFQSGNGSVSHSHGSVVSCSLETCSPAAVKPYYRTHAKTTAAATCRSAGRFGAPKGRQGRTESASGTAGRRRTGRLLCRRAAPPFPPLLPAAPPSPPRPPAAARRKPQPGGPAAAAAAAPACMARRSHDSCSGVAAGRPFCAAEALATSADVARCGVDPSGA